MPAVLKEKHLYLKETLGKIIGERNWEEFDALLKEFFLEDIAHQMRYFSVEQNIEILKHLGPERAGLVMSEINPAVCDRVTSAMDEEYLSRVLSLMHTDDATDVVECLPDEHRERLLGLMDTAHANKVRSLLKYPPNTAGGIMSHNYISIKENHTLGQAIEEVRAKITDFLAPRIYVVDDTGVLKGFMSSGRLLMKNTEVVVKEIMKTRFVKARVDMHQEDVAHIFARYDLVTLPVVDEADRLAGIIMVDDIVDVIREEATEDALKMSGTHTDEFGAHSVMRTVKARLPWLFASWLGGLAALLVIGRFESTLEKVIVLSAFIPVVMGMGGNAGNQAAAVIVRGLAMGYVNTSDVVRVMFREIRVGLMLGITYGALLGIVSHVKYFREVQLLGVVVGLSIISAITMGVTVGTFFPMFFKRINIDPALATAPFVATTLDIGGILVFFMLAKAILGI